MVFVMKPNIVIVMTDQQRADLRKSRGYPLDTMPFLDSLGHMGVDFEQAYTPCPTCLPARVSMFTGRYSESHRARTNHNGQDAYYSTDMLELLKTEGYTAALCGKNHSHHPETDFDFAETCGHLGHEGNLPQETEADRRFADFLDGTDHMEMHSPAPGGVEAQHPYRNVSSAFSFLDAQSRENPFFLWLSFAEPHNPYQVPEPYYDMFPPESLPKIQTTLQDGEKKGHKFSWIDKVWQRVLGPDREARVDRARSNYHGMLRLIDDQLKRFYTGLQERDLIRNTILIFVSDHGDFVGEYGLIRKGPDLPEVLTRIPCTWCGPGVAPRGTDPKHCVSLVDIFPTLCDIIGAEIPLGVQGKSIRPLLENQNIPEKEYQSAYAESGFGGLYWTEKDSLTLYEEGASRPGKEPGSLQTFDCLNTWTQAGQVRMLRRGNYKIQLDMLENGYLYDLENDPREMHNLFYDPVFTDIKADMLAGLMAASLRACDPLPVPRHRYHYKRHPKGFWFAEDFTI